jgi:hypothetical protein
MAKAQSILKDIAFGVVVGAVLAVIAIRCIELYARSYVAQADLQAAQRVFDGAPCESRELVF